MKKFKRVLSLLLAVVMLVGTMELGIGGLKSLFAVDADALIGVETNAGLSSITTPQAIAPETVYLKPGTDDFQYFSNINVTEGIAAGSKDATGTVSYKNQSSTDTKIYVNNLWHKVGKTGDNYETFAIGNLELGITGGVGNQTSITLAGVTTSNYNVASGATVIGRGSNSATAILNTSSKLKNANPGDVYMIEWVVVSTIDGTKHFSFMYTGIYVPSLQIAGTSGRAYSSTEITNVPDVAGFSFVTGAMEYSDVSNRYNPYTATSGVNTAPLIKFVGQQNNGNDYTIPNKDNGHYAAFPTSGTGKKTVLAVPKSYKGTNALFHTTYSNWGSYAEPTPSGTNSGDVSLNGESGIAPVAYEVVDTSRFTNFNQIPNLQVGYIRYYHNRGGDDASLQYIRLYTQPTESDSNYTNISASVDSSDHDDDEDKWRSRTYGLYTLNGTVATGNKGYYVMSRYNEDITVWDVPIHLYTSVGLYVQGVNKEAQRKGYCAYLTSVIDNVNDSSFSTTYANMKKQACRLCDPTCTDAGTVSGCTASDINTKSQTVISNNSGALYFHVPETIYLNPANEKNFQYYVNYAQQDTASALAEPNATSGNFYFHYKGASKVTALYVQSVSGATLSSMTLGGQSLSGGKINIASVTGASTANISTTITAGSLGSHADAKLKWTLYYVDKASNTTQSVVAYSYVHAPYTGSVGCEVARKRAHWEVSKGDRAMANGTVWITGIHSMTANGGGTGDFQGAFNRTPLTETFYVGAVEATIKAQNAGKALTTSCDNDNSDPDSGDFQYTSGSGWIGYWQREKNNGTSSYTSNYDANILIDNSRYTNLNQIPNLIGGVDIQEQWDANEKNVGTVTLTIGSTNIITTTSGNAPSNKQNWRGYRFANYLNYSITSSPTSVVLQATITARVATANPKVNLSLTYINKSMLRQAYNYYLENAPILQPDYFTGSNYSTMMDYLDTVTTYLGEPDNATTQTNMNSAATNLYNKVSEMKTAVTNPESTTYTKLDGTTATLTRSNVLASSTAYNRHYSTRTNALISGQGTNPETINYFYGDTVTADKNNYTGYQFKYAEVTKPFDGAALVNNRSSNSNTEKPLTWDAASKTLTFKNNTTGTDNFNPHPGYGADGSNYYYIPVIPKTEVTLTYTATGTTSQVFMFGMGNDMKVPGSSWTDGQNLKSNYSTGNQTLKWTVPENIYYVTFRFGNQTANSSTIFSNIKITMKTAVPDEINNASGAGIEWKMYYDPHMTTVNYSPNGGSFNGTTAATTTPVYYDDSYTVGKIGNSSPAAPTRAGYRFDGWLCDADSTVYTHGQTIGTWKSVADQVTYTAQWTKIANDDTFIVDSGAAVKLDVLSNDISGATLSSVNATDLPEGVTAVKDGTKISFSTNAILDKVIRFTYTAAFSGVTATVNVTVIPATMVYYEETFVSFWDDTTSATPLTWHAPEDASQTATAEVVLDAARAGDYDYRAYGSNDVYTSTNSATYSLGTAKMLEPSSANNNGGEKAYATFTFTGTGFEVNTLLSAATGNVKYTVQYPDGKTKSYTVSLGNGYLYGQLYYKNGDLSFDSTCTKLYRNGTGTSYRLHGVTYYTGKGSGTEAKGWLPYDINAADISDDIVNGEIYQVPAIYQRNLPYGTYTVKIIPRFAAKEDLDKDGGCEFYLDSVKIFDPVSSDDEHYSDAEAAYMKDSEYDAKYETVRKILVDSKTIDSTGTLTTDDSKIPGVAFLGGKYEGETSTTDIVGTYKDIGPKNEVYLEPGNVIAFKAAAERSDEPAKLALGVKLAYADGAGTVEVNGTEISVTVPTEKYFNINSAVTWTEEGNASVATIVITNSGDVPLSLTDIRYSYDKAAEINSASFDEELQPRQLLFFFDDEVLELATQSNDAAAKNVLDVKFDPAVGTVNTYQVKVNDRANMIQFMELDHGTGTRSFDRYNDNVTIVSYDKDGNVVSSTSKDLAYEIWTVETNLAEGKIGVRVKEAGSAVWEASSNAYEFENNYAAVNSAVISAVPAKTEGAKGSVKVAVIAGADAQVVQLKNKEGETFTFDRSKATENADGTLTFNCAVYFHGTSGTVNTATIRVNDTYGWHDSDVTVEYTIK